MSGLNRDVLLREMSRYLTDFANWAVEADEYEISLVNDEMNKLLTHLKTARIVQEAEILPDIMSDESL
jgi:hypothetical protein